MTSTPPLDSPAPILPPLVYSAGAVAPVLPIPARVLAAFVGAACLSVLILAVHLTPSPTGVSTHTALGLDRCQFLARTGLPCPSCGMTTSFSWFVRGNFAASLYIQPMGTLLALLTAAAAWTAGYIAITGKPAHRLLRLIPSRYYLIPLMGLAVAAWGWKIFIHLQGIDGWR